MYLLISPNYEIYSKMKDIILDNTKYYVLDSKIKDGQLLMYILIFSDLYK